MTDAEWMRTIRTRLGLTQAEMAFALGYSVGWIRKVETGKVALRRCQRFCIPYISEHKKILIGIFKRLSKETGVHDAR